MKEIWIVDYHEAMGRAVSLMLKLLDCNTKYFFNPRNAAQALLAGGRPELMILDINMPVMNGIEFMEKLTSDEVLKNMPVVVVSTEGSKERIERLNELGIKAYLRKPTTPEEITEVINKLLAGAA